MGGLTVQPSAEAGQPPADSQALRTFLPEASPTEFMPPSGVFASIPVRVPRTPTPVTVECRTGVNTAGDIPTAIWAIQAWLAHFSWEIPALIIMRTRILRVMTTDRWRPITHRPRLMTLQRSTMRSRPIRGNQCLLLRPRALPIVLPLRNHLQRRPRFSPASSWSPWCSKTAVLVSRFITTS